MLKVYSSATPNGHPVRLMREERAPANRAIPVDIGAGALFGERPLQRR